MGLTAQGRLALLTNVRGAAPADPNAPSRGRVVTDWLAAREDTGAFWMRTALAGYNSFNLVAADFARGECFWASNTDAHTRRLEPGVYGLSNGTLDAPWPKVTALKDALRGSVATANDGDDLAARLFAALADRNVAPDAALPQTGIPLARERQLSAAFIRTPDQRYGTRCSTVLITERVARGSVTHVLERSFDPSGGMTERRASLTHWPPRYVEPDVSRRVGQSEVSESADQGAAGHAGTGQPDGGPCLPAAHPRRNGDVVQVA
jgi:uncharacterized protein with NRDE domain